jgi:two-component system chemotaxis response regulator CheY
MNLRSEEIYRAFRNKLVKSAPKEVCQEFDEIVCIDKSYVNKFHILLADDSRFILKAINSKLQQMGFLVTTVENGILAENFLDKNSDVDLIITDINMPKLNGIELIKRVRNKPDYSTIPIVVISTEEKEVDKAGAKAMGADDYIIKPINYTKLRSIIDKLILEKKYKIKDNIFKDSRSLKRKEIDIPFFGTMEHGIAYGHCKNISLNGMELFTNSLLKDKSVFNIRFSVTIEGMKRNIKTDCIVRWINEGSVKGEHRAGIEFTNIEKRMSDLLEKFLNET